MIYEKVNEHDKEIESIKKLVHDIDRRHSVSDKEGAFLYNIARFCTGKGVIVEIGSWKGVSTIWLGKGSKKGNSVKIYAIDPHTGSLIHREMYGKVWTFEEFKKNIKLAQVEGTIIPIVETSEEAAKNWNNKFIEFLWIDGDHLYNMVKLDFNLWSPFLINKGIIAFHDVTHSKAIRSVVINSILKSKNFINIGFIGSIVFAQKTKSQTLKDRFKKIIFIFLWSIHRLFLNIRKYLSIIKNKLKR
jgi:MMP 1-O-methyltransferase